MLRFYYCGALREIVIAAYIQSLISAYAKALQGKATCVGRNEYYNLDKGSYKQK